MNYEENNKLFQKMIAKYGDILSGIYITSVMMKCKDPYEVEKTICKSYVEELEYNKIYNVKYNYNI